MPSRSFDDANAFHRAMRTFIATKVGVALFRPTAHHLDRLASKLTGGRRSVASIVTGVPAAMLTTIGAKSREPRTVAVYGIPHREGLAVIASNFGGAQHPAWYHDLKANPNATVTVEGDTWDAVARTLHPTSATRSGPKASKSIPAGGSMKREPALATSRRSSSAGLESSTASRSASTPSR
jgi:deazaflavin-dependent oxidoreductase (nitroreductase family)